MLCSGDYKAEHRVFEPDTLDGVHVRACYPKVVNMVVSARRWFTTKLVIQHCYQNIFFIANLVTGNRNQQVMVDSL